jgi:hypothetical protein
LSRTDVYFAVCIRKGTLVVVVLYIGDQEPCLRLFRHTD